MFIPNPVLVNLISCLQNVNGMYLQYMQFKVMGFVIIQKYFMCRRNRKLRPPPTYLFQQYNYNLLQSHHRDIFFHNQGHNESHLISIIHYNIKV